jgi:hypothetical protein
MQKTQKMLNGFIRIRDKYSFFEEKTGAKFNIYSVARIERMEELVHSRMITELLNPKGSHGQGNVFLEIFLRTAFPDELSLDCERAIVEAERPFCIASLTGRIDIIIELDSAVIVIENKIDAPDQNLQMARYRDYAKTIANGRAVFLLYLTPDRRDPNESSMGGQNQPVVDLLAYPDEIALWLDQCLLSCVNKKLFSLIEGISQYRRLIDKITGKTMNADEKKEIDFLLENHENLLAAKRVSDRFQAADFRGRLLWKFLQELQHELTSLGFRQIGKGSEARQKYEKFIANEENLTQWCARRRNDNWEYKALFLDLPERLGDNFFCCVMFATDALHYGLIPKTVQFKPLCPRDWEERTWPKEISSWWSCIEDRTAYKFDSTTLENLTLSERIGTLAKKIEKEITQATGEQQS